MVHCQAAEVQRLGETHGLPRLPSFFLPRTGTYRFSQNIKKVLQTDPQGAEHPYNWESEISRRSAL